jgi:hypothetical protein
MKNTKLSINLSTIIDRILTVIFVLVVLVFLSSPFLYAYGTQRNSEITIKKMERIVSSNGRSSKYLIFAEDGVYENTDNLLRMKFDSADIYSQLQKGKTYMCNIYGWRVPLLSIYPNIVKCKENNK